jgi:AmmeMemoRadiSam system protein B/AmmeMemoRadiSam system protein A
MNAKQRAASIGGAFAVVAAVVLVVVLWPGRGARAPEGPASTSKEPPAPADPPAPKRAARPPAVAGGFYPGEPDELRRTVRGYLDAAAPEKLADVRALVSPHAGYPYSGPVAAYGYRAIEGQHYKTVIVMAPAHHYPLRGASIPNVAGYETPLGTVPLSPLADVLRAEAVFHDAPEAHEGEHSIEVQLPFLQVVLDEFELVPILVGDAEADEIAAAILKHLDDETLLVASSDLSHYLPYELAKKVDAFTVRTMADEDADLMELCEACGKVPVEALLRVAQKKGWHPHVLDARNSGDTAGPKDQVVGYCSVAFAEEAEPFVRPKRRTQEPLDEQEQQKLLELARAALEAAVKREPPPVPDESEVPEKLRRQGGTFVTLTEGGALRGCVGQILPPYAPLYQSVIGNAASAALRDPRFLPVKAAELDKIHIEVSVLTVPQRLRAASPEQLLAKLTPGEDGVLFVFWQARSTYLPQVWEQLPDKAEFMSRLSQKAGLPADAWRHPSARIFIYHAQVFEEQQGEPIE